jgi:hypothetical protein
MQIGATFSIHHLNWLGIDPLGAIKEYKELNLKWIRLGCYWSEIEKEKGKHNFSCLDPIVKFCEKENINIVLTVGLKAPRWPEYYIPRFYKERLNVLDRYTFSLSDKTLIEPLFSFIRNCAKHFGKFTSIKVIQVENEPFETFGPKNFNIDINLLKSEIKNIKEIIPDKKICVNLGTESIIKTSRYKELFPMADIVGFDLYYKIEMDVLKRKKIISWPKDPFNKIPKIAKGIEVANKTFWISELQAEPWENDGYNVKNPKSFLPEDLEKNLKRALKLKPEVIFFWGFEYWLYRKLKKDDTRYWDEAKKIIIKYS